MNLHEQCSKPLLVDDWTIIQEGNPHQPTSNEWNDRGNVAATAHMVLGSDDVINTGIILASLKTYLSLMKDESSPFAR